MLESSMKGTRDKVLDAVYQQEFGEPVDERMRAVMYSLYSLFVDPLGPAQGAGVPTGILKQEIQKLYKVSSGTADNYLADADFKYITSFKNKDDGRKRMVIFKPAIFESFERVQQSHDNIDQLIKAQLDDPMNVDAGREYVDPKVFFHPLLELQAMDQVGEKRRKL